MVKGLGGARSPWMILGGHWGLGRRHGSDSRTVVRYALPFLVRTPNASPKPGSKQFIRYTRIAKGSVGGLVFPTR